MFGIHAVKLPFSFNHRQLQSDLAKLPENAWISHYRSDEYKGDWAVLPLRSVCGHAEVIYAVPNSGQPDFYQNTALLEQCPSFLEVLSVFQCPIGAARLMRLGAGARILEHRDHMGDANQLEIRLHIPIQTNDAVQFWVDGHLTHMHTGELWYADFSRPHHVENNGSTDRIHLVVDCLCNDWLAAQINKAVELHAILQFLEEIGIPAMLQTIDTQTFLPGIAIENGAMVIDPEKLQHPGDILHEAGHIAVTESRSTLQVDMTKGDPNAMGLEIAAILWSYAALTHIGLPPESVFHTNGYRGSNQWFIDNFTQGSYMGLPLLEWMGLTAGVEKARLMGVEPFPHMLKWLR
ncbi:MAG: aspartyl/asparaginyl beta-hydroxylase domain-containing protein [Saprospiraceae bacterium]|nr:aspartyl/asparaginyl beta-hydroxylase domain-containing protein [Saprospiraceae bacterium]